MCLVGVVVRRYIDFLIILIPTPIVSVLFLQQQKNVFRSCSGNFCNLCKNISCSINTHTGDYGNPTAAI